MDIAALDHPAFWASVLQVVAIDLLLGGDNAMVIALACRKLPPQLRLRGIVWGAAAVVTTRATLTLLAVSVLALPFLRLAGAVLLVWIGVRLMLPARVHGGPQFEADTRLTGAIRTVVVADAVMSVDNILAVAAAAGESRLAVVCGLAISIPVMVAFSRVLLALLVRFAFLVAVGAGLIGWVALGMAVNDAGIRGWIEPNAPWLRQAAAPAGAAGVVLAGWLLARRRRRRG